MMGATSLMFEDFALASPDPMPKVINPPSLKVFWGFLHLILELVQFPIETVTQSLPRSCFTLRFDEEFGLSQTVNTDEV